MKVIQQYELKEDLKSRNIVIAMPAKSDVLHVRSERHNLYVYAVIELDTNEFENRTFYVTETNAMPLGDVPYRFVGAVMMGRRFEDGEDLVHVFELLNPATCNMIRKSLK